MPALLRYMKELLLTRLKSLARCYQGKLLVLAHRAASDFQPLSLDEVVALEKVVDCYRQIQLTFSALPAAKACMLADMRSRLVLVTW